MIQNLTQSQKILLKKINNKINYFIHSNYLPRLKTELFLNTFS